MAYADYQQDPTKFYPGGTPTFNEGAQAGQGPMSLIGPNAMAGPMQPQTPAPTVNGAGQLPTNTRSQNLAQVQQAYATPPRAPGDMGYLNGLLSQSSQAPSASDPIMAGAFGAGRVADQRNIDRQRAALAEQLGNQGLGQSGAMNTRTQGIQQQVGEQQALRESGMLYDESNARRNALLQGLGLDQSRYQGDNQLGYQLAALEAQLNGQAVQPFLSY